MKSARIALTAAATFLLLGMAACGQPQAPSIPPTAPMPTPPAEPPPPEKAFDALNRVTFNRIAVQMNLPVFWIADSDNDGAIDPGETASPLFYSTEGNWVEGDAFTPGFETAYAKMQQWAKEPAFPAGLSPIEKKRREFVIQDLDQGRPTLVLTDLRAASDGDKSLVRHMLAAARHIDALYARQNGLDPLRARVPKDDPSSLALFQRNWGPKCVAPLTENNADCAAIPDAPKRILVDVYPAEVQRADDFCDTLGKRPDGKKLMAPFVLVRKTGDALAPVALNEVYGDTMALVAKELRSAANGLDAKESALKTYLMAAAQAFTDNNWEPADEAWAKMNATNSRWYLRIAPDEVYWDPCSQKAGFHMGFAHINQDSLRWQKKLEPVQQELEDGLAKLAGAPYRARKVTFHLPDFIDIIANAGDARHPLGATIGQSLPNWGPVANEGRGRTVAMSNLYTDPDSIQIRRDQAASMLTKPSFDKRTDGPDPGLLSVILHEATHNLGPAHEYKVRGKTDSQLFGGPLASTMEELKAQSGALWYIELLQKKGIIDKQFADESYVDSFIWALNHIARGMYSDTGKPKPYSHLAAIQIGFLMEEGAITFDADTLAANEKDKGAFTLHFDKLPAAIAKLMKVAGVIKAQGDKAKAEALVKKYVDGDTVPMKLIAERSLRHPKATFLYAIQF